MNKLSENIIAHNSLVELENNLSYTFKNKQLLKEALQHSSYVNEHPEMSLKNNERLEFLGDAVLNLVVGHLLMNYFQDMQEGYLSRMRATLVNEIRLAEVARKIDLPPHLLLGKGELHTNGREKSSILADTLEAIIAAIYLDDGFETSFQIVELHFSEFLKKVRSQDYKSELQEYVQGSLKLIPCYKVIHELGPDHKKTFKVELKIGDTLTTQGDGTSKKSAEQDAAEKALESLKKQP
ncbi:Ribonuclease 3 [Candidatus Magnetomoraceae bacterium gMMP-15]